MQSSIRSLLTLVLLAAGCRTAGAVQAPVLQPPPLARPQQSRLAAVIDSVTNTAPLNGAQWGIEVLDLETGRTIHSLNADRHFIPASNMKLVVTSAAMSLLGPAWTYKTVVTGARGSGDGAFENVVVAGSGDPTMSRRFFTDDYFVLRALADTLAARGVRRIANLVIDGSAFESLQRHPVWELGDEESSDASPVSAFAIGESSFWIRIFAGARAGVPAQLRIEALDTTGLYVRNEVMTASPATGIEARLVGDTVVFTGSIAPGAQPYTNNYAVRDPLLYAGRSFAAALRERGIHVEQIRAVEDSTQAAQLRSKTGEQLAVWTSPALSVIIAGILKPSQNWMAEQLCKTLAVSRGQTGSWSACTRIEREFLIGAGVDSTSFLLRDASGLATQNLISPHAAVSLLRHDWNASWRDLYRGALPEPSDTTGTLSGRFRELQGRIYAKTGTLTNVVTLAGYIRTETGRMLAFGIFANATGVPGSQVRRGIDRIVQELATLNEAGTE